MTIQDHLNWNTLERVTSDDLNNMSNLASRMMAELAKTKVINFEDEANGTPPTVAPHVHVSSGLNINQNAGTTILVNPGMLCQQVAASPPDVPTPDTYDSTYRFGMTLAVEDVGDPWDATNAWWLLQGRVVQVVALSEIRDVYNPATQTFAPSALALDKIYESQIEYDWKKGTATTIATADAGWAPIGAVYRAAGGGAITDAEVVQLTIQINDLTSIDSAGGVVNRNSYRLYTEDGPQIASSGNLAFNLSAEVNGYKLFAKTVGWVSIRDAEFCDPTYIGDLVTGDVWWYLYLCVGDKYMMPSGVHANIEHRGSLVLSRVAPTVQGTNSAQLTIPNPVGGTVAAKEAAFVGAVRTFGGAALISTIDINASGEGSIYGVMMTQFTDTAGNSYQNGVTITFSTNGAATASQPGGTELIPYGVAWNIMTRHNTLDILAAAYGLEWYFLDPVTGDSRMGNLTCRATTRDPTDATFWYLSDNVLDLQVASTGLSTTAAPIALVNVDSNIYDIYLIAIRF